MKLSYLLFPSSVRFTPVTEMWHDSCTSFYVFLIT